MRQMMWSVVAVLSCALTCRGQSDPGGQEVVAVTVPGGTMPSAPECSGVDTFLFEPAGGPLFTVLRVDPGEGPPVVVGFWSESSATVALDDLPCAIGEFEGTVDWVVATGTLFLIGHEPRWAGLMRAEVTMTDPSGAVLSFMAGSTVPYQPGMDTEEVVSGAFAVLEVDPEEPIAAPGGTELVSVGSSCHCPRCPNGGHRFWVPFYVIGVGLTPSGQMCCRLACDFACDAVRRGKTYIEAWALGQGTWVTCMICGT